MNTIGRVDYHKKSKYLIDFEIVTVQTFFETRKNYHIDQNKRLNFWVLLVVTEGSGKHYIDFKEYNIKKGDILVIKKNQVHSYALNQGYEGYVMNINEPFLFINDYGKTNLFMEYLDYFMNPLLQLSNDSFNRVKEVVNILFTESVRVDSSRDVLLIKSLFDSFMLLVRKELYLTHDMTVDNSMFIEFRDLVESEYKNHSTLDYYAEELGVTKKTINQLTRKLFDLSAKDYINQRLLLEIKRYLSQGELKIYEISNLLGFDEAGNMTNFFKRYEGISPKEFRLKQKKS